MMGKDEKKSVVIVQKIAILSLIIPSLTIFISRLAEENNVMAWILCLIWVITLIMGLVTLVICLALKIRGVKHFSILGVLISGVLLIMASASISDYVAVRSHDDPYVYAELEEMALVNKGFNVVINGEKGYRFELPTEFVEKKIEAEKVHFAYNIPKVEKDSAEIVFAIKGLGGTLEQKDFDVHEQDYFKANIPPGMKSKYRQIHWTGIPLNMFINSFSAKGRDVKSYVVEVPLVGEAVQINLSTVGKPEQESVLLIKKILNGFKGRTNWQ